MRGFPESRSGSLHARSSYGAGARNRTADLRITSASLCQLSYSGLTRRHCTEPSEGFRRDH
jgi:hypothetical protein